MTLVERLLLANAKPRGRQSVYKLNEFAFKEPLSPLAMYFLGIMYTDGCIWREGSASYRIQLGLIDYDVIDKFIEFLDYTGISHIEKKKISKPRKIVQVTSEVLGNSLISLGCGPKKTFITKVPDRIKQDRDFWRGVIDGDGSLVVGTNTSLDLRSASEKFIDQFIEFGLLHGIRIAKSNDGCYRGKVYGNNARNLAKVLYNDCTFAMQRKLNLYKDHFK